MKKILSIFLILFLTVSLSACAPSDNPPAEDPGTPPVESPDDGNTGDDTEEPHDDDEEDEDDQESEDDQADKDGKNEAEDKKEEEVNLYFVNSKYVETGDETLDHLISEKRMINYQDTILEEAIVRELLKGPESADLTTGIPETVKLLEVKVIDKIAYVDFSSDGLTGASLQETLTIEQIVENLTQLDAIDKVQFLVDGSEADSLMGHVSIDQPFEGK